MNDPYLTVNFFEKSLPQKAEAREEEPLEKSKESILGKTKKKRLKEELARLKRHIQEHQRILEASEAFLMEKEDFLSSRKLTLFKPSNGLLAEGFSLHALTEESLTFNFLLTRGDVVQFVIPKRFVKQQFKAYSSALDDESKDTRHELITIQKSLHPEAINYALLSAFQRGVTSLPFRSLKEGGVSDVHEILPDLLELSTYIDFVELKKECLEFMASQLEKSPTYIVDILELCLFSNNHEFEDFWYEKFNQLPITTSDLDVLSSLVSWVNTSRETLPSRAILLIRDYLVNFLKKNEIKQPLLYDLYIALKKLISMGIENSNLKIIERFDFLCKKDNPESHFALTIGIIRTWRQEKELNKGFSKELNDNVAKILSIENFNEGNFFQDILFIKSKICLDEKNYMEGLKLIDQAIELGPEFSRDYLHKSQFYRGLGKHEEELNNLNQGIKLCPDEFAFLIRAFYHSRHVTEENSEECLKDFDQVIKLNPHCYEAFLSRGQVYLRKKMYEQALRDVQCAREFFKSAESYKILGEIYTETNQHKEAIDAFTQGLDVDKETSNFPSLLIGRSFSYQALGEFDKAINDINMSLKLSSDCLEATVLKGILLKKMGLNQEGFNEFLRAIRLEPTTFYDNRIGLELVSELADWINVNHPSVPPEIKPKIADSFINFLNYKSIKEPLIINLFRAITKIGLSHHTKNFLTLVKAGLERENLKSPFLSLVEIGLLDDKTDQILKLEETKSLYEGQTIEGFWEYIDYYQAEICFENKEYKTCISNSKKILNHFPAAAHFYIGASYFSEKNYLLAMRHFDESLKHTYNSQTLYFRGLILFKSDDLENSLEDANRAIDVSRYNPWPHLLKAKIYLKQREYEKAESEVQNLPNSIKSWKTELKILTRKQKISEALEVCPENLELKKRLYFFYLRSLIYSHLKQIELLNEDIGRILELDPHHLYALEMKESLKNENLKNSEEKGSLS